MNFLIIVLTVYGISSIVTISKIFAPLRDFTEKHSPNFWSYLTKCMQCLPFWIGIFVSFALDSTPLKVENIMFPKALNILLTYLFTGALFSGTTYFIHTLYTYIAGEQWKNYQEMELKRKIQKGILKENDNR